MRKLLAGVLLLYALGGVAQAAGPGLCSINWRTEATNNASSVTVTNTFGTPLVNGDFLLLIDITFTVTLSCPTGWSSTNCGTAENLNTDEITECFKTWHTGDATSVTSSSQNFPTLVVYDLGPMTAIDACSTLPVNFNDNTSGTSGTVPALSNTVAANECFLGVGVSDQMVQNGPTDLNQTVIDRNAWGIMDGVKTLGAVGTTPNAETYNYNTTANGLGYATSLLPPSPGVMNPVVW